MDVPLTFGQWVRNRRKSLDLTQTELADLVGCSVSAIRKIENGDRKPSRQVAALLADCLRVNEAERATFLKVARGEREVDRLPQNGTSRVTIEDRGTGRSALRTSLPVPLTPLVGREHELNEVLRLLAWEPCRLLTLVGPGGIGKTRVALEAASQLAHKQSGLFVDGVTFLSLAAVDSVEGLLQALADALGFIFQHPEEPAAQLTHFLRDKKLLLGLDNLEHLLESVGFLSAVLQQAPGVKLLVTSRQRLNMQAEWVFEVQGLPVPVPGAGGLAGAEALTRLNESSAVALFLQTARRVQPDFDLTVENGESILRICQALEGMPLGIELAAAWVRVLSCREIAEEINRGLDILVANDRNVPERHRSLKAAFDHSWRLLSEPERAVMRKLSVFRGSIRREAAQAVAGANLNLLLTLVDQSLLRRSLSGYNLHELIRQYAADHLEQDRDEERQTREAHSAYFLGLLEQELPVLMSARQKEALDRLETDIDNFRQAWDWASEHHQSEAIRRAAGGWYYLTELRGAYLEGVNLFSGAGERLGAWQPDTVSHNAGQTLTLAVLNTKEAFFRMRLGQQGQAEPLFNMSIGLLRPLADQREARASLARALVFLGTAEMHMGNYQRSREHSQEALDLAREVGETWYAAYALVVLGLVAHAQGQTGAAYQHFQESMRYWRRLGDPHGLTLGMGYFGIIANAYGRPQEALDMLRECLAMTRGVNDRWGIATALNHLGQVELTLDGENRAAAMEHLGEAVEIYREMGDTWNMLRAMVRMGSGYHLFGEDETARRTLVEAIRLAWESPVVPVALDAMVELAVILMAQGAGQCARRLLAPVRGHPQCAQETLTRANWMWQMLEEGRVSAAPPDPSFDETVEQVLDWAGNLSRCE